MPLQMHVSIESRKARREQMSCAQLVAELSVDDDASGVFSIDEILSGPRIESSMFDDPDEDDWLELLDIRTG
jgi:hypothetical protein